MNTQDSNWNVKFNSRTKWNEIDIVDILFFYIESTENSALRILGRNARILLITSKFWMWDTTFDEIWDSPWECIELKRA